MSDEQAKKYEIFHATFLYESQMYWQRSELMLIGQAVLGGGAVQFLVPSEASRSANGAVLVGIAVFGLALCALWGRLMSIGEQWTEVWHKRLEALEKDVLGDANLARKQDGNPRGAKQVGKMLVWVFIVGWLVIGVRGLFMLSCPGHPV